MTVLDVILIVLGVELIAVLAMALHARRQRQARYRPPRRRRVPPKWTNDEWRWPR